jgi:hypothetical protein
MALTRIDSYLVDLDSLGGITFDDQAGTPTFKVDAVNHRVGIGTTNPLAKLSVGSGSISDPNVPIQINAPTGQIIYFGANKNGSYGALFGHDFSIGGGVVRTVDPLDSVNIVVNNTTLALRAVSNGNIGIGTTNPITKLDTRGALHVGGGSDGIWLGNAGDNTAYDNVKLYYTGFNSGNPRIYLTPRTQPGSGTINTYLHLLSSTGVGSNNMGLLVDGNVGIGTTNPVSGLSVTKSGTLFFADSVWMQPSGNTLITARGASGQDNWMGIGGHYYATSGSANLLLQANFGDLGSVVGHYISSTATGIGSSYFSIGRMIAGGGIGTPAAKQPQLNIDVSGNVGIGTTNPPTKLSIYDTTGSHITLSNSWVSGSHAISFVGGSPTSNGTVAQQTAARIVCVATAPAGKATGDLKFVTNSGDSFVNALYIAPNGNVGIGTTDPLALLHVYGNVNPRARIQSLTSSAAGLDLVNTAGGATSYLDSSANLRFYLGSDRVTFTQSGNVGIGTTNPGVPLDVKGIDSLIRASEAGSGTAWRSRIISQNPDGAVQRASFLGIYGTSAGVFAHNSALNGWAPLFVNTTNGSSDGDNVILAGSGNVGIGTVNPATKLETHLIVQGQGAERYTPVDVLSISADNPGATVYGGFGQGLVFRGRSYNVSTYRPLGRILHRVWDDSINTTLGSSLEFQTSNNGSVAAEPTTKMTIGYNGNVGIGTTNPTSTLHVQGQITVAGGNRTLYGPNPTWGAYLAVGGDGNQANTNVASVVTTNGNLHLDSGEGSHAVYLNWYGGNNGIYFGNGDGSTAIGRVDGNGNAIFAGNMYANSISPGSAYSIRSAAMTSQGNVTFSWTFSTNGDSTYLVTAAGSHYGLSAYQCMRQSYMCTGPNSSETNLHNYVTTTHGNWTFTWASNTLTVTHNAGTYNGQSSFWVTVEGA